MQISIIAKKNNNYPVLPICSLFISRIFSCDLIRLYDHVKNTLFVKFGNTESHAFWIFHFSFFLRRIFKKKGKNKMSFTRNLICKLQIQKFSQNIFISSIRLGTLPHCLHFQQTPLSCVSTNKMIKFESVTWGLYGSYAKFWRTIEEMCVTNRRTNLKSNLST